MCPSAQQLKTVKLHPYFMLRVAGLPISVLDTLSAPQTAEALKQMQQLRAWSAHSKENICAKIETYVGKTERDDLRKFLINFKREVFNDRTPKKSILELQDEIPVELCEALHAWENNKRELEQLQEQAAQLFQQELLQNRLSLQTSINHPNFLNGLVFSSRDMWHKVSKYMQTPIEQHHARLRKAESSLLQFLTRVAGKTSPLSTFTPIAIGQWHTSSELHQLDVLENNPISVVDINHAVVERILLGVSQRPDSRSFISYKLNPSMTIRGNKLHIIKRTDDSKLRPKVFNTVEQPVTLDYNPALQFIHRIYQESNQTELNYEKLVEYFCQATQQERQQVEHFLGQLINLQIIVPSTQSYEQTDDKLGESIHVLEEIMTPVARQVREQLQSIHQLLKAYVSGSPSERLHILEQIEALLAVCFKTIEYTVAEESLKTPIYEDAYIKADNLQLAKSSLHEPLEDLAMWQKLTPLLDSNYRLQSMIATAFVEKYGEEGCCEQPLDFVSELVPIMKKWGESLLPSVSAKELVDESEDMQQLNQVKNRFLIYLLEKMAQEEDEVVLPKEDVEHFATQIPQAIQHRTVSQSYFCQWGRDAQGQDFIVTNQMYHGYSMFFSRFLKQYPEEVTENIRQYLKGLFSADETLAEYSGTFGFNANLHPALAELELSISSLPLGRRTDRTVAFETLSIKYDKRKHRVYLAHPKHGKINVLYLGFLMPFSLPLIVRALSQMFNSGNISTLFIMHKERSLTAEESLQIRTYPRIKIGKVVLSRKKWIVPNQQLPVKEKSESDFEYFARLHAWISQLNLPRKVFVRLIPMNEAEAQAQANQDDQTTLEEIDFTKFKPQYIDFEGPLFIKMLEKLIKDTTYGMVIEEMSPQTEELPLHIEGEPYVAELLIELSQSMEEV